ncbi:MAG TPA: hypothetical protein VKA95_15415 [Nitrososphaeraceae archaeon]|nr:hypothetical protein [Nitrososphaeraceae archaeon]
MNQLGDMKKMTESICVGRLALCQDFMTIVNATETSVNHAQTELQAGNTTGAMMMLSNAERILSALRGNMTVMIGGR